jgi:hypothetical protein
MVTSYSRHIWASAVAAYTFRLKKGSFVCVLDFTPYVHRHLLFVRVSVHVCVVPIFVLSSISDVVSQFIARHKENIERPYWSVHIRHGDLKALASIYRNKQVRQSQAELVRL